MAPRPVLPVPPWLLAADFLAALALGFGLFLHFDPALAQRIGLPPRTGLVLAGAGALGLAACVVAIVRHLASRRTAASRLPH